MAISYDSIPFPIREDISEAHRRAWDRIARPGSWLDAKTRVSIASETRHAVRCAFCRKLKAAISPYAVVGDHDSLGTLPGPMVDQIHRIVADPGRLTRRWFESLIASGVSDTEYVETVGVVITVVSIDTFCRAIGAPRHPLPDPVPGEPHRRRPRTAHQRGEAWVPMIHPTDLEGELDTEEERVLAKYWGGVLANIRRALSLVPEEAYAWFQIVEVQYLPGKWMRDFTREFRAISHAQIELIAGRVSVRNQCFY
jgi:hypothetical protein